MATYSWDEVIGFGATAARGGTVGLHPAEALNDCEPWGVWLRQRDVAIVIARRPARGRDLALFLTLHHLIVPPLRPVSAVRIALGHHVLLDAGETQPGVREHACRIPSIAHRDAPFLILRITGNPPIVPREVGLSDDGRSLGLGLVSLRLSPIAMVGA